MKNLKYVSLALIMFFGIGSLQAQQKDLAKTDKTEKKTDYRKGVHKQKMQKELNLTSEQTKQIEDIRANRADEKAKLRSEMKRISDEERNEIQAVYTPEQKEKMKELRENKKGNMKAYQGKRKMKHKKMRNKKRR